MEYFEIEYDVCEMLGCSAPTLQKKVENPLKFTLKNIFDLKDNGLDFTEYFLNNN
jgi:hypothetical protein